MSRRKPVDEDTELEHADDFDAALQAKRDKSAEALADMLAEDFGPPVQKVTPPTENGMPPLGILREQYKTKSAIIRYLASLGKSVKEISAHTGIRYQHVRNVMHTELKRGPNEDWRPKPNSDE